jgi:hypothetical protein
MPYVLILIVIFLGSMANSVFHELMFCHCVASADVLSFWHPSYASLRAIAIILTACLETNASNEE